MAEPPTTAPPPAGALLGSLGLGRRRRRPERDRTDHRAIDPITTQSRIRPRYPPKRPLGALGPVALVGTRPALWAIAMIDSNALCLDYIDSVIGEHLPLPVARELVVHEFEKRYLREMLTRHGSVADAARQSGIALRYFQLLRKRRAA